MCGAPGGFRVSLGVEKMRLKNLEVELFEPGIKAEAGSRAIATASKDEEAQIFGISPPHV